MRDEAFSRFEVRREGYVAMIMYCSSGNCIGGNVCCSWLRPDWPPVCSSTRFGFLQSLVRLGERAGMGPIWGLTHCLIQTIWDSWYWQLCTAPRLFCGPWTRPQFFNIPLCLYFSTSHNFSRWISTLSTWIHETTGCVFMKEGYLI